MDADHATANWVGARTWLAEHGTSVELDYSAETFSRLAGRGEGPRLAYRGTIDLMLLFYSDDP